MQITIITIATNAKPSIHAGLRLFAAPAGWMVPRRVAPLESSLSSPPPPGTQGLGTRQFFGCCCDNDQTQKNYQPSSFKKHLNKCELTYEHRWRVCINKYNMCIHVCVCTCFRFMHKLCFFSVKWESSKRSARFLLVLVEEPLIQIGLPTKPTKAQAGGERPAAKRFVKPRGDDQDPSAQQCRRRISPKGPTAPCPPANMNPNHQPPHINCWFANIHFTQRGLYHCCNHPILASVHAEKAASNLKHCIIDPHLHHTSSSCSTCFTSSGAGTTWQLCLFEWSPMT